MDRLVIKVKEKQGTKTLFCLTNRIQQYDSKPFFKVDDRIRLERDDYPKKNNYHQNYILNLDGQVFGIIRLYPYGFPGNDLITLSISNYVLYRDFTSGLKYILNTLDLTLNNISYMEICVDSQFDYKSKIVKMFLNKKYVLVSSTKIKNNLGKSGILYKDGSEEFSIYIGSNNSNKQVIGYNKTKELEEKNKLYLKDIHFKEFGNDNDVHRLEVKLNNTSFVNYRKKGNKTKVKRVDIDLMKLNDEDYLVSIFSHFFNKLVDFRKNTNKNISRCEKVKVIDFENITIYPLKTTIKYQDTKNNNFRIEKGSMKKCISDYSINPNKRNYDRVQSIYTTFIKSIEPLEQWYKEYLRKIDLKIIPPKDETNRISLFDYKLDNYKIPIVNHIDFQEFTKNNPVNR